MLKVISTAFFKTYIADRSEYSVYFAPAHIQSISSQPFELSLVKSLTEAQLEQALSTTNE